MSMPLAPSNCERHSSEPRSNCSRVGRNATKCLPGDVDKARALAAVLRSSVPGNQPDQLPSHLRQPMPTSPIHVPRTDPLLSLFFAAPAATTLYRTLRSNGERLHRQSTSTRRDLKLHRLKRACPSAASRSRSRISASPVALAVGLNSRRKVFTSTALS